MAYLSDEQIKEPALKLVARVMTLLIQTQILFVAVRMVFVYFQIQ